jgi:RHS repeat-associated protein
LLKTITLANNAGTKYFIFDRAGNELLAASPTSHLEFNPDPAGKLTRMTEATQRTTTTLTHDGRGFLAKARNSVTDCGPLLTTATYSSDGLLYHRQQQALFTGAVQAQTRIFYFAGRPVAQLDGPPSAGTLLYLTADHLGTPILASTSAAVATWSGGFEAFGRDFTTPSAQSSKVFLRLPGQWDDPVWNNSRLSSGLYYNVNRWYESVRAAYTASDLLSPGATAGLYSYALARPTRLIDRLGLFTIDKSCDNMECLLQHGYTNLLQQLKQETQASCEMLGQTIYGDAALLMCLQRKCRSGRIYCHITDKVDRTQICNQPNEPGAWGPPGGEAHLCPGNWTSGVPPGYLGDVVLHEWAHNCGWKHDEGKGIPCNSGECTY